MPTWVPPPDLELQLWYGDLLVADLHEVFPHQGTWFSTYELKISAKEGPLQDKLLKYIAFSEGFNDRIRDGEDHDFAEFDRFDPIPQVGSWRVRLPDGGVMPMEGRLQFAWGMATWQQPETPPGAEAVANELWVRVAGQVSASHQPR